ncbi:hypothetical protein C0Q70_20691 [Pomacea canaliculata]|uniref:Uncharacterized protein n=1 Tax=Pomacea canaliculata TaxID=400727 RepID=A0A2T7NGB5_POMCA|nr:hypothetical protein C0Q70_20691 [Pomacea canaliculata]
MNVLSPSLIKRACGGQKTRGVASLPRLLPPLRFTGPRGGRQHSGEIQVATKSSSNSSRTAAASLVARHGTATARQPPVSLSLEVSDGFLPPSRSCCASAAIFCDDQHGARRLVSANRGRRYKRLTVYAAMRVDVTTARMSSHLAAAHEVHREEAVVNMTTLFVAAVDVTSSCRGGQDDMSR